MLASVIMYNLIAYIVDIHKHAVPKTWSHARVPPFGGGGKALVCIGITAAGASLFSSSTSRLSVGNSDEYLLDLGSN
jgi:hypothetical protein